MSNIQNHAIEPTLQGNGGCKQDEDLSHLLRNCELVVGSLSEVIGPLPVPEGALTSAVLIETKPNNLEFLSGIFDNLHTFTPQR
jgi:hypothetical protein